MERLLTTGTLSGLGRHIHEKFGGSSWTRDTPLKDRQKIKTFGVDVIVHCAFNSSRSVSSNNLYVYFTDNVLLTQELVAIPHKKFIFLSSIDVYPKQPKLHSEDEVIDVNKVSGIYGITKLLSESLVKSHCHDHLVLRCTSLLGRNSRKNSLIRLSGEESYVLTLTSNSRFNYILHSDVSDFIQLAIRNDIQGIYNAASSSDITLQEIADMLGRQVNFGTDHYDVGDIDNSKITAIFPKFKKTSKDVIDEFILDR